MCTLVTLPRCGRPGKMTASVLRVILYAVEKSPRMSAKSLAHANFSVDKSTRRPKQKWMSWEDTKEEATALQTKIAAGLKSARRSHSTTGKIFC